MEQRGIVQPPLTWDRMGFPAPLLSFLHLNVPRDIKKNTLQAAAGMEEDVHWAAGRERGVNPF